MMRNLRYCQGMALIFCCIHPVYPFQMPQQGMGPAGMSPSVQGAAPQAAANDQWTSTQAVNNVIDEGRGDWFKKKKIVKDSRNLYQRIEWRVDGIAKFYQELVAQHEPDVVAFEKALKDLVVTQADIEAGEKKVEQALATQEKEIAEDRDNKQLKQTHLELQDSKKMLDELQNTLNDLNQLKNGVQQALQVLKNQMDRCNAYVQDAWRNYEQIDEVFSDRIADILFKQMQTIAENVELVEAYMRHDLVGYFEAVRSDFNQKQAHAAQLYKTLKERAVLISPEAAVINAVMQDTLVKTAQAGEVEQGAASQTSSSDGWLAWIAKPFKQAWAWTTGLFRSKK